MTALIATVGVVLVIGLPFGVAGVKVGRKLEQRDVRRRIARAHRPPRAPAREVVKNARLVVGAGARSGDHPVLALVGKPAFGDRAAGDLGCFDGQEGA